MIYSDKTVSAFPVAIGTSLALESLFEGRLPAYDASRTIPNKVSIYDYDTCYINIATLYRNFIGALVNTPVDTLNPNDVAIDLEEEMAYISSLFEQESNRTVKLQYYIMDYRSMMNTYSKKKILFRIPSTNKQLIYEDRYMKSLKLLRKSYDGIVTIPGEIKSSDSNNVLIMTHIAYDLLSYRNFKKLDLLESHTGLLRDKYAFGSKYYPVNDYDMSTIPFNKKLLMVFGDKNLIQPSSIKLRKLLIDIAMSRKWTPHTTKDKITYSIENDIKEPFVRQWLLDL